VAETRNLRFSIGAVGKTDGDLDDFETQPGCTEDEIKIAERIEVAEMIACVLDAAIVGAVKNLDAAQRIGEALPE
jgi:hypothetical protein